MVDPDGASGGADRNADTGATDDAGAATAPEAAGDAAAAGVSDDAGAAGAQDEPAQPVEGDAATARRKVVVPEELFRVVVVFSTVLALLSVVLGFVLLDAATRVLENPTGSVFVDLARLVTGASVAALEPHLGTIALVVGLLGLAAIGLGAWVYAVGTRFRTDGMGKHKEASDEGTNDG